MARIGLIGLALLGSLCITSQAEAQVSVRVDAAPSQVRPGETFEVAWTITSPQPVTLTTVIWGTQPNGWNQVGSLRSGPAGTFRTNLTAPASGTVHWTIYVRTGSVRGVIRERTTQVTNTPGPTPQPPAAASNLTAAATSQTTVDLAWADNSTNERSFFLQRRTSGGSFAQVAVLQPNVTTYADTGLTAATTYEYRVIAANDQGSAQPSNTATVTTPAAPQPTPPAAPTSLSANVVSGTQVDLSWTDNSTDETAFIIGRRSGSSGQFTQVAQVGANTTRYSDTSVTAGNSYQYSVFATNAAGDSSGTNVVQAATPTATRTVTATRTHSPALDIPDDDAQGATSTVQVNDSGSIQSLEIDVDVEHTWRGDIQLVLTSPGGTSITLFDAPDNDQDDDVRGTFPTSLTPQQSLAAFNGQEVRGLWSLKVVDTQGQDTGTLRSWTVRARVGTSTNPPRYGLERRVPVTTLRFPLNGSTVNPPTSLRRVRAFPNLSFRSPVFLTAAPDNTDRVFVIEQAGIIKVFPNSDAVTSASTFLDIRNKISSGGEMGLLGLAFDPSYATNRTFYVNYTASSPRRTVIARYRTSASNPNRADANSEQVVLTINQPYSNHNGGMIAFGRDNMLYIGMGDGGSGGDPQGHGQNRDTLLGNILRINVRGTTTYTVPSDNPFVNTSGARDEIWAYGIRNPWRFSFDRGGSGALWLGDVGQNAREEIDIVRKGGNYGWARREGNARYNGSVPSGHVAPVLDYTHSEGRTVVGGYVYRGNRLPGLRGIYLYGDYVTDKVWALKWNGSSVDWNREVASVPSVASFGEDQAGEVYAVSYNGQIYRFENNSGGSTSSFPQTLSQTGIFQSLATLTPNPGIIEYSVNAPLWSDNSLKKRWIAVPGSSQITFRGTGNWSFPVGTVLVKHFELEMTLGNPGTARRLETRVLIHENNGWAGYTYKWNAAGTDAVLLASGDSDTFTIRDASAPGGTRQQVWTYPSRVDCMNCHTAAAGRVLGPRTGQLNGEFTYPLMRDNQLRSWNHIGLFTSNIGDHTQHPAWPDPKDVSASLSSRARAYMATNCMHCHQPGGPTPHAVDLRYHVSRAGMNMIDVTPNGGSLGIPNARIVRPGDRSGSVLFNRIDRRDSRGMPQIGTNLVDPLGRDLIGQWIDAGAP